MKILLFVFMFILFGCEKSIDIQINPYFCVDEFRWDFSGDAMVDEYGAILSCESDFFIKENL